MTKPTLYLIGGAPGSGKSTVADILASKLSCAHVEADMYFTIDGEYRYDPALLPKAHAWCLDNAKHYLKNRITTIVSNTHTRYEDIETYQKIAEECDANFYVMYAFNDFGNVHEVPKTKVAKIRSRIVGAIAKLVNQQNQKDVKNVK